MASDNDKSKKKKQSSIKPALTLLVAALIIFGVMYAFMYFQNENADWLMPRS